MKLIGASFVVVAACAVGLGAQTSERTTKSKVTIKDGKDITVVGCVEPNASGTGYMLTHAADKDGRVHSYMLVSEDVDLAKHAGDRVEIKGKAADRGDGKIETESKTTTKGTSGEEKETHGKSEIRGDLSGLPFLGVKTVKMIAAGCP